KSASRRPRGRVAAGPPDATGTSFDRRQSRRPGFPAHLDRDYPVPLRIWAVERRLSEISTPPAADLAHRAHELDAGVRGSKGRSVKVGRWSARQVAGPDPDADEQRR